MGLGISNHFNNFRNSFGSQDSVKSKAQRRRRTCVRFGRNVWPPQKREMEREKVVVVRLKKPISRKAWRFCELTLNLWNWEKWLRLSAISQFGTSLTQPCGRILRTASWPDKRSGDSDSLFRRLTNERGRTGFASSVSEMATLKLRQKVRGTIFWFSEQV